MNAFRTYHVDKERTSLERFGIAISYHPHYVQQRPDYHRVDALLVTFVARGSCRHMIENAAFEATEGSVGVTRLGEAHTLVTRASGVDIYNIFLDPVRRPLPPVHALLYKTQQILFPPDNAFRTRLDRSVHFQLPDSQAFRHCLEMLRYECANPASGSEIVIESLQRIFVIFCCRAAHDSGIEPAQPLGQHVPRWVVDVCRYMDLHSAEAITLNGLCNRYRLSRGYLCRGFKRYTGVTLRDYLINRRLEYAKQALRSTTDKVLSIALQAGFNDLTHFNRTFKARMGLTPTAYRQVGTIRAK